MEFDPSPDISPLNRNTIIFIDEIVSMTLCAVSKCLLSNINFLKSVWQKYDFFLLVINMLIMV